MSENVTVPETDICALISLASIYEIDGGIKLNQGTRESTKKPSYIPC